MSDWFPGDREGRSQEDSGLYNQYDSDSDALLRLVGEESAQAGLDTLGSLLGGDAGTYDRSVWRDMIDLQEQADLNEAADLFSESNWAEIDQEIKDGIGNIGDGIGSNNGADLADEFARLDSQDMNALERVLADGIYDTPLTDLDQMADDIIQSDYQWDLDNPTRLPTPRDSIYDMATDGGTAAERAAERSIRQEADAATYSWVKDRGRVNGRWSRAGKLLREVPLLDIVLPLVWPEQVPRGYFDDMWNEDGEFDNNEPIDLDDCKRFPNAPHCKGRLANLIDLFDFSPLDIEVFDDGCQKIWSVNAGISLAQMPGIFVGKRDPKCKTPYPQPDPPPNPYPDDLPPPPPPRSFYFNEDDHPPCNRVFNPYRFAFSARLVLRKFTVSNGYAFGTIPWSYSNSNGIEITTVIQYFVVTQTWEAQFKDPIPDRTESDILYKRVLYRNYSEYLPDHIAAAVGFESNEDDYTASGVKATYGSWIGVETRRFTFNGQPRVSIKSIRSLSSASSLPNGGYYVQGWDEIIDPATDALTGYGFTGAETWAADALTLKDGYLCPLMYVTYKDIDTYNAWISGDVPYGRFELHGIWTDANTKISGSQCNTAPFCNKPISIDPPPLPPKPPKPPKPPMSCCDKTDRMLGLLLKEIKDLRKKETQPLHKRYVGTAWGTDSEGITIPSSLITADDKTTTAYNWPQLFLWFVGQTDGLFGQWPIEIEVEQEQDGIIPKKPIKVELANVAEAMAELYGLGTATAMDSDVSVAFLQRLAVEVMQIKTMSLSSSDYIRAIVDFMDFPGAEVARDLPMSFSAYKPNLNRQGKDTSEYERSESIRDVLKQTTVQVRGYEFQGESDTLTDAMQKLLYAAAIIKAVHVRNPEPGVEPGKDGRRKGGFLETIGDIASIINAVGTVKGLFDENGEPIAMDYEQFIKDLKNPNSLINRGFDPPEVRTRDDGPDPNDNDNGKKRSSGVWRG